MQRFFASHEIEWLGDLAPVRSLGAILCLVSGLGALGGDGWKWLAGSSFDGINGRVQMFIGLTEVALFFLAVVWPREGAMAATVFFCVQRMYQNLQLSQPFALVLLTWIGVMLIAMWEMGNRNDLCLIIQPKTRLAIILLGDRFLLWGTLHTIWFGINLLAVPVIHPSVNVWVPMPDELSVVTGAMLIFYGAVMLRFSKPRALWVGGLISFLMRLIQGIQLDSLYVTGFWIIVLTVGWWSLKVAESERKDGKRVS